MVGFECGMCPVCSVIVNQLNQVVQVNSAVAHDFYGADPAAEPLTLVDFQFVTRYFFDFNNNLVLGQVDFGGDDVVLPGGIGQVGNPFLFTGRRLDAETRLWYYRVRYCNSEQGRFVGRDPMRRSVRADSRWAVNLYLFVDDNSLNGTDPFGTTPRWQYPSIPGIVIKRNNIRAWVVAGVKEGDGYGHWWIEIDGTESYGWWPKEPVAGLRETLRGVAGEMNGQTNFGGTPTRDPHHGDTPDEALVVRVRSVIIWPVFQNSLRFGFAAGTPCCDLMVKTGANWFVNFYSGLKPGAADKIKDCLRKAVSDFASRESVWKFPGSYNCHSFQEWLLEQCCLDAYQK